MVSMQLHEAIARIIGRMTNEAFMFTAVVIDAVAGAALGLIFGRRRLEIWLSVLGASAVLAFTTISGVVVVYELMYGTHRLGAGLGWAVMYAPVNFILCVPAVVFFLIGASVRMGIHELAFRVCGRR